MMLGIPMVWVTSGMALTEVPALMMACIALTAGLWATRKATTNPGRYLGFALCGLFVGLAILGRQTYLPLLLAFLAIAMACKHYRAPAFVALLIAFAVPLPAFILWQGLVPPGLGYVGRGVSVTHGLLAFSYLAIVVGIVAPRFFARKWTWVASVAISAAVINIAFAKFEWAAGATVLRHLPNSAQPYYGLAIGSLLLAAGAAFAIATILNIWAARSDKLYLLICAQSLLLTGTSIGVVHIFSSRYVMTAFPFVMLMAQPFFVPSKWAAARMAGGAAIGAVSLGAYFRF
jgi:hypothetical protein